MKNNQYKVPPYKNKALGLSASLTFATFLSTIGYMTSAEGAVLITGIETGNDVVLTLSGSLNTTGLTSPGGGSTSASIISPSNRGTIFFSPILNVILFEDAIANPDALIFGTGGFAFPSSSNVSGFLSIDTIGNNNKVFLPSTYQSGDPLSGEMIFNNETFASLGITPGTNISAFNSGANEDTITYQFVAASSTTPEPSTILGSIVLLGLGSVFAKKE